MGKTQAEAFDACRKAGLGVNMHYIPVHTQPYYQKMGFAEGDFPEAENYYKRAISIPLYQGLSFEKQQKVVDILTKVLS